jgi:UDP-N-acetylmuramoyl-tripeptide--D-alanyl-D-alanine ligase
MGVAIAMGIDPVTLAERLEDLPDTPHRQTVSLSETGFKIIDDTFNSNPAGATQALRLLAEVAGAGKRVVVTPGMVELGPMQGSANEEFAADAARMADHLVVVGATNRKALIRGSANGTASVTVVESRARAVDWVRENLASGDAVLYENDLPDHYP